MLPTVVLCHLSKGPTPFLPTEVARPTRKETNVVRITTRCRPSLTTVGQGRIIQGTIDITAILMPRVWVTTLPLVRQPRKDLSSVLEPTITSS